MAELFENQKRCLQSHLVINNGRADKKFYSIKYKNAYHNERNRKKALVFKNDDKHLHKNWDVLNMYYEQSLGNEYIPIIPLYQQGFDPSYYCGTVRIKNTGETLYVLYNYAFLIDHSEGIKIYFKSDGFHRL